MIFFNIWHGYCSKIVQACERVIIKNQKFKIMFNFRTIASILFLTSLVSTGISGQNATMAAAPTMAVGTAVAASADRLENEAYLPYAEPLFGMEKEDYEDHFNQYREGALMDRVLDLHHMELQAVYTDSKMNEINVSFNSTVEQEVVLNIYDAFGEKVKGEMHNITTGINNYSVDTKHLSDGFYSLVVIGDNDQFIQRFIIE